jgi:hypothetical protein
VADNINQPPLLHAHEIFTRVVRIARFDGMSVLIVSGAFALLAAAIGDFRGAVIGVLIAGAGAMEMHGVGLLRHGDPGGMHWLVRSQIFLLITLLGYCALRLTHPDLESLHEGFKTAMHSPAMQQAWAMQESMGMTEDRFLRQVYTLTYFSLAIATLIYQGGMAIFYVRRRDAVHQALES